MYVFLCQLPGNILWVTVDFSDQFSISLWGEADLPLNGNKLRHFNSKEFGDALELPTNMFNHCAYFILSTYQANLLFVPKRNLKIAEKVRSNVFAWMIFRRILGFFPDQSGTGRTTIIYNLDRFHNNLTLPFSVKDMFSVKVTVRNWTSYCPPQPGFEPWAFSFIAEHSTIASAHWRVEH